MFLIRMWQLLQKCSLMRRLLRKIKRRHKKEDEVDVSDEEIEAFIATLFNSDDGPKSLM